MPDDPTAQYEMVECSRCHHTYLCTPADDFYDVDERFGWTAGGVCLGCLLAISALTRTVTRTREPR